MVVRTATVDHDDKSYDDGSGCVGNCSATGSASRPAARSSARNRGVRCPCPDANTAVASSGLSAGSILRATNAKMRRSLSRSSPVPAIFCALAREQLDDVAFAELRKRHVLDAAPMLSLDHRSVGLDHAQANDARFAERKFAEAIEDLLGAQLDDQVTDRERRFVVEEVALR